jgi:hypothetical protein
VVAVDYLSMVEGLQSVPVVAKIIVFVLLPFVSYFFGVLMAFALMRAFASIKGYEITDIKELSI